MCVENLHLITDIEMGSGLVQNQKLRFLDQRAGQQGQLPLAAAQPGAGAPGKMGDTDSVHRATGFFVIDFRRHGQRLQVRSAAHDHDLFDRIRKHRHLTLRDITDGPGQCRRPEMPNPVAIEQNAALATLQQAAQTFEKSGFSSAVGTQ